MRWFYLLVMSLILGCAAPRQITPEVRALPEGEGLYEVRYNPPGCLAEQPELHLELRIGESPWERIYVEPDGEDPQGLSRLLERFAATPKSIKSVSGNLTGRVVSWTGKHVSRVFVLTPVGTP